ncbi:MAG: hypothetical protein GX814_09710 [Microbacteriaceae bacterium]|nr:hypothetical protein [Microbacteriaceae bacterium]
MASNELLAISEELARARKARSEAYREQATSAATAERTRFITLGVVAALTILNCISWGVALSSFPFFLVVGILFAALGLLLIFIRRYVWGGLALIATTVAGLTFAADPSFFNLDLSADAERLMLVQVLWLVLTILAFVVLLSFHLAARMREAQAKGAVQLVSDLSAEYDRQEIVAAHAEANARHTERVRQHTAQTAQSATLESATRIAHWLAQRTESTAQ